MNDDKMLMLMLGVMGGLVLSFVGFLAYLAIFQLA